MARKVFESDYKYKLQKFIGEIMIRKVVQDMTSTMILEKKGKTFTGRSI